MNGPMAKNDKLGSQRNVGLNTQFERSLSKLSENHNIFDFRSTEFKLWQLKDSQNQIKRMGGGVSFNCHNFSKVDPMYDFLKA